MAYAAKKRDDLLSAINSFLEDSVVLAPGDWDRHLLLPLLEAEVALKKRHRKMLLREKGDELSEFFICYECYGYIV